MRFKILVFIILDFIIFANLAVAITCTIRTNNCASGEYPIFSTYQRNDTHAGNYSEYPQNIICCSDPYLKSSSFKKFCGIGEFSFLAFYNYTDSHVETFNNSVLELRFEENSGDLTFDSSGNGNHGKIYGATWVDGKYGKALSFDGVDDYVSTGKNLLNNMNSFTLTGWIYPKSSGSRIGFFGQNDAIECGFIDADTIQCWTSGGGYVNWDFTSATFPFNEWHYIAAVGNGSNIKLYVDGELKSIGGTSTTNYGSSSYFFNIGGGGIFDASGNWFNGTIDEVRIYNRALTEDEIKHLYYEYRSCVSSPWICKIRASCLAGETCVTSLFQLTNTHLGECGYYSYQLCCKKEDISPSYSNVGQNATFIYPGNPIKLYAYWKDNGNLSYAILSTNETGNWENKTTYGSPYFINFFEGWSNFTWQNSSIPSGKVIAWKIYANDSAGNWNVTPVMTFEVATPISLKDTTGTIPLKGWGETFTFKANVSHAEGYTVNVTLWYAYASGGPWYFLDSQNCTLCSQETQLTFSSNYFTCDKFVLAANGRFYYKFNATDYVGGANETSPTYFDTRKDNTQPSIVQGEQSSVDRYGANSVTLKIGIIDLDVNQALPPGRNCSIFVGNKRYNFQTDSTGNCTLDFNPDCSANYFSPGIYDWLGGVNETDACYNSTNSTKTNVTIWGQLFSTLENPPQTSNFPPGSQINVTGNVTSDCSQEGLITGATSTFELKLNTTTNWESCTPVNEFSTGYYNCTWNSTGKPGGYYDVRFNSSKQAAYYRNASSTYPSRFYLQALVSIEISSKLSEGILFTNDEGSDTNRQLPVKINQWNNATWNYHGWWNFSWNKRKRILINNTANPNELVDYQVFVNITYDSDMQADFSDLRFTWYNFSSRKEQEISYWIENYTSSSYADVWIKVPRIRASSYETVYVYYGNNTPVASKSNGDDTLFIYENYTIAPRGTLAGNASYDSVNKWVQLTDNATGLLGYLYYNKVPINPIGFYSKFYFWVGGGNGADAIWLGAYDTSYSGTREDVVNGGYHFTYDEYQDRICFTKNTTDNGAGITCASETTIDNSQWHLAEVYFWYNGSACTRIYYDKKLKVDSCDSTVQPNVINGVGQIVYGGRTGGLYNYHRIGNNLLYTVKYTSPNPTTSIGEEETKPSEIYQTEFWIKNTGTNPEDFCLKASSDLTCSFGVCTGVTISIDNVAWNNSTFNNATYPSYDTTKRLSLSYQKVAFSINPNNYTYFRFWLFVPVGKPSGIYNSTFSVRAVEAGGSC
jgi:hypothetical protein